MSRNLEGFGEMDVTFVLCNMRIEDRSHVIIYQVVLRRQFTIISYMHGILFLAPKSSPPLSLQNLCRGISPIFLPIKSKDSPPTRENAEKCYLFLPPSCCLGTNQNDELLPLFSTLRMSPTHFFLVLAHWHCRRRITATYSKMQVNLFQWFFFWIWGWKLVVGRHSLVDLLELKIISEGPIIIRGFAKKWKTTVLKIGSASEGIFVPRIATARGTSGVVIWTSVMSPA